MIKTWGELLIKLIECSWLEYHLSFGSTSWISHTWWWFSQKPRSLDQTFFGNNFHRIVNISFLWVRLSVFRITEFFAQNFWSRNQTNNLTNKSLESEKILSVSFQNSLLRIWMRILHSNDLDFEFKILNVEKYWQDICFPFNILVMNIR